MTRAKPTEREARTRGSEAGYRSMRRAKRKSWNIDDASMAIVEYRKALGLPGASIEAAKVALADLTSGVSMRNHKIRPSAIGAKK